MPESSLQGLIIPLVAIRSIKQQQQPYASKLRAEDTKYVPKSKKLLLRLVQTLPLLMLVIIMEVQVSASLLHHRSRMTWRC